MTLKEDVNKLSQALDALKSQQAADQATLSRQLALFSLQLSQLSERVNAQESHLQETQNQTDTQTQACATQEQLLPEKESLSASPANTGYHHEIWHSDKQNQKQAPSQNPPQKGPRAGINPQLAKATAQLQGTLGQIVPLLLGPFAALGEQAKGFYDHYRDKGQSAVFLMTLAGIITLTLGFGYLLQYSINHWFSEMGKAILALVTANTVIAGGLFIRRARPGMEDYASGIVGLGVILNYLAIYFLGPYYELIPESLAFLLMLANTLLGYGLSMKLATKVVAVIALCGGSLAPLMLLDASQAPLLYLPYLLIIGACSLAQSHRLNWPALIEITALLHIACVQLLSFFLFLPLTPIDSMAIMAMLCINGLFYLYGLSSLALQRKMKLNARLLMVPVAMLCFILYTLSEFTAYAGEIFAINALISVLIVWKVRRDPLIAPLMLAAAGVFAGIAALYLISAELLGLVLLVEALLLLWLGCKHDFISIRTEAYLLLLVGIASNLLSLFDGLTATLDNPVLLSMSMVLTTLACWAATRLITTQLVVLTMPERLIHTLLREALGQLACISILFIAYLISDTYYLTILPLLSLLLLHYSARGQLRFSEILAWIWLLPLVGLIFMGTVEANSITYGDQPLNAKLARIELFSSLLLAYYWYKRHFSDSPLLRLAYYVQLGCYLALPLLLLPKVLRSYQELLPIYLWLASALSLALARLVRHRSQIIETQILVSTAMLTTAISCLNNQWQGLIALALGALAMGSILRLYAGLNRRWRLLLTFPWHLSPFYFALVVAVAVQSLSGLIAPGWSLVFLALTTYFALLLERDNALGKRFAKALKPGYRMAYGLLILLSLMPIILHSERPLVLDMTNLLFSLSELGILLVLAWYLKGNRLAIAQHKKLLPKPLLLWGWHGLLAMSYFIWSYQLGTKIAAPISSILLVCHGSTLMFISLRPRQESLVRLAGILFGLACIKTLFVDMASFELLQKVVAFIIIGAILLTVAYFYQKSKNRLQAASQENLEMTHS